MSNIAYTSIKTTDYSYEGYILNDLYMGFGRLTTQNSKFSGFFHNGKKCGDGIEVQTDGSKYIGDYLNDKRHGKGFYINKYYEYNGQFKNDKLEGYGVFTYPNGVKLSGHFKIIENRAYPAIENHIYLQIGNGILYLKDIAHMIPDQAVLWNHLMKLNEVTHPLDAHSSKLIEPLLSPTPTLSQRPVQYIDVVLHQNRRTKSDVA